MVVLGFRQNQRWVWRRHCILKFLTYPRTDARALPEDYLATVKDTLKMLTGEGAGKGHDEAILARFSPFAHQILARNWVLPNKRIFNNTKISDHFAIIPTLQAPKKPFPEPEQKLYDTGRQALPYRVYPAAEYDYHAHHACRS